MLQEFKADLVEALEAAMTTGGHLDGIAGVFAGDTFPELLPGVTVDTTDGLTARTLNRRTEVSFEVAVVVYVAMLDGTYEAKKAALNNLVVRCSGGVYKGVHPFLSAFENWTDSTGQKWSVDLQPEAATGLIKSDRAAFASLATAFRLRVSTWLNPSQYGR